MTRLRVAVDVGGTFTDFVVADLETGSVQILKLPTSTGDESMAFIEGLDELKVLKPDVEMVAHGTTVGTNALVERRGLNTALVATEGFRDLLEIRRAHREELYDLEWTPPEPLIARRLRFEVSERVTREGEIYVPLDEEGVRRIAKRLVELEVRSVAVAFLHSYISSQHERRAKEILLEELGPDAYVTTSSEVVREIREFERTSTTACNAYIGPVLDAYLAKLEHRLTNDIGEGSLVVMQSNGGLTSPGIVRELPVKTVKSGPAAGVIGVAELGRHLGISNLIGLDIGGTSADISVVWEGETQIATSHSPEWGMPILFPSVDVLSIGAGGGSVAWVDDGGSLRVGPESAGSEPGPACYNRGGTRATVTDANLIRGFLNPQAFAGGLELDIGAATNAVRDHVAAPLGFSVARAAEGIIRIMEQNMAQAVRLVTLERGFDPREFTMIAFGGAGPTHAVNLARELGVPRVVIPPNPGVFSAYGLLFADIVHDVGETTHRPLGPEMGGELSSQMSGLVQEVETTFARLESEISRLFQSEGLRAQDISVRRIADIKYRSQSHSLSVDVPSDGFEAAVFKFHDEHRRVFGHSDHAGDLEVTALRVIGHSPTTHPPVAAALEPHSGEVREREVQFAGAGQVVASIHWRGNLEPGDVVTGPAIIEQRDSTVAIPPEVSCTVDDHLNLVVDV